MLEQLIEADPLLRERRCELSDYDRGRVRGTFSALDAAWSELLVDTVSPREGYPALLVWTLKRAAILLSDLDPVSIVLERERLLVPHDAPRQAEMRCAVTMVWLRHTLGIERVQGGEVECIN